MSLRLLNLSFDCKSSMLGPKKGINTCRKVNKFLLDFSILGLVVALQSKRIGTKQISCKNYIVLKKNYPPILLKTVPRQRGDMS